MDTETLTSEYQNRLEDLKSGPWKQYGEDALRFLAPKANLRAWALAETAVDLKVLAKNDMKPADRKRRKELKRLLKPHWQGGICSDEAIAIRDSFDWALSFLQILELAIETGYLPVELVRPVAREQLLSLCWSGAARRFVRNYEYLAVEYLANRVGVEGFRKVDPPSPEPSAAIRFATFLSQHVAFVENEAIGNWLAFLDDYVEEEGEQDQFYDYLESGHAPRSKATRFQALALGGCEFAIQLVGMFDPLAPNEVPRYGLMYVYWLAKFFGFELDEEGYTKNTDRWGKQDSWAEAFIRSPVVRPKAPKDLDRDQKQEFEKYAEAQQTAFKECKEALEKTFEVTLQFIAEHSGDS